MIRKVDDMELFGVGALLVFFVVLLVLTERYDLPQSFKVLSTLVVGVSGAFFAMVRRGKGDRTDDPPA